MVTYETFPRVPTIHESRGSAGVGDTLLDDLRAQEAKMIMVHRIFFCSAIIKPGALLIQATEQAKRFQR